MFESGHTFTLTHGHSRPESPTYGAWRYMLRRCRNANCASYRYYGGRGIKVCERWLKFENFLEDMGEKPSKMLSLSRIDNDGDYKPSNCEWATTTEQNRNRRCVKLSPGLAKRVRCLAITLPITWIAEALGVSSQVLYYAVNHKTWK